MGFTCRSAHFGGIPTGSGGGSVDPELALRASAERFRARVQAGNELAASDGRSWNDLRPDEQLAYYARARLTEGGPESR